MKEIHITEDCIIYNDMPRGWREGKGQPKWHKSLYNRWVAMWMRCRNSKHKEYNAYKDCKIDERYRCLSNYVNDIMTLENFDKLCENLSEWDIDKDVKDSNNRHYYFENLSIISKNDNCEASNPKRPIIAINIKDGSILTFDFVLQVKDKDFTVSNVVACLKGRQKTHKGYKWYYKEE